MNELKNDKNLREAISRREKRLKPMPADLNEQLMQRLGEQETAPKGKVRRLWLYTAVAVAASITLLIVFYNGQEKDTAQQPLVAQQMVKPTAVPSQPVVEGIGGRFCDPVFDENGITEPSPDSLDENAIEPSTDSEPTQTEKVETPRHFSSRPVIEITSPKDELFFLASTSYMVAPNNRIKGRFSDPISDAESEDGSAILFSTKMASQNPPLIPQVPSVKENFHKLTKKERKQMAVLGAIDMRRWHIDINMMNTLRYGSRMVSPDFYLELRGDTLRSYLPYLGQVQVSSTLSPPIGLNFEEPVQQYKESVPKSNKYTQIDIDVRTREDSYHYVIEIYNSGEATIRVRSMNRDPVSFDGTLEIE